MTHQGQAICVVRPTKWWADFPARGARALMIGHPECYQWSESRYK